MSNDAMKTDTNKAPKERHKGIITAPIQHQNGTNKEQKISCVAVNRPVFKWAGGKFSELDKIAAHMPGGARLIEPFVGGGSVFMNLNYPAYLCADFNGDLITAYTMIKERPDQLLKMIKDRFETGNTQLSFLMAREKFNDMRFTMSALERAADFIYLNRHCTRV
ncbi:DNA adenine methylase [Pantoea sp. LMR881]|nr:DNA adenine methylase [Pantoea sp. LMR881]MCZ4061160.1 DNA adenine methylase [Pantoea sp. LMR881]